MTQTCSKATNSLSTQQPAATPSQAEHLSVNFILFDRLSPRKPLCVDVPRSLFDGKAQDCRHLFSDLLLDEFERYTKKSSINFWKPNEHLLLDTATKRGWAEHINEIEEFCTPIPLPRSFATALLETDNADIVHLVVTADALNAPRQKNTEGSPSTNHSAQNSAAYEIRENYAHLPDLQRRILEYILSRSDLSQVGGPDVSDITRAVADPEVNDAFQISDALENLLDDGLVYNTIDDSHFQACN